MTGISQSPARPHQRRPEMGLYAALEEREEARYLPRALEIVRVMWPTSSTWTIADEITARTHWRCSVKAVYALKARLDTIDRTARE
jgi:hypothetical protein